MSIKRLQQIPCTVRFDQAAALSALAKRRSVTTQIILREAIDDVLAKHPPDPFDAFLRNQGIEPQQLPEKIRAKMRSDFERGQVRAAAMRARVFTPGTTRGHFYAIAIKDGADLRLTLWIKRSLNGQCYIFYPRDEGNPHASYHSNGAYHHKSENRKWVTQARQRIDQFKGAEHLGGFLGHGTEAAPKINPVDFTAVLAVPKGILEARRGSVIIDLVEPGCAPHAHHRNVPGVRIIREETYRDCVPWLVVAIAE